MPSRLVPIGEWRPAGRLVSCEVEPVPLGIDVSLGVVDVVVVGGAGASVGVVDELGGELDEMVVERVSDAVDSEPVEALEVELEDASVDAVDVEEPDEVAPPRLPPEPPPL